MNGRIDDVFAFAVSRHGNEQILCRDAQDGSGVQHLIARDRQLLELFRMEAEELAALEGLPLRIAHFKRVET